MRQANLYGCCLAFLLSAGIRADDVPLLHWGGPPYWSPSSEGGSERTPERWAISTATRDVVAVLPAPLPFVAIPPCRQYDSRSDSPLPNNTPRTVVLTGAPCGIPANALAVSVNITVFNISGATGNGVFKVDTVSPPAIAWINFPPTESQRGNAGVVPLTGAGAIVVQVNQGAGSLNFVVDVNGYFAPANEFCIGGDCRTSWNNQDGNSVTPLPRDCPVGQIAVSTGSFQWTCAPNCPMGTVVCSESCANVTSDPANCGSCAKPCPPVANGTATCVGSACAFSCNVSYTKCGSTCVNTQTDPINCGTCGTVCALGRVCVNSTCVCNGCIVGPICNAGNIDATCGAGGAACVDCTASGKHCVAGVCI